MAKSINLEKGTEDYELFMDSISVKQMAGLFIKITPEHPMLCHHRMVLKDKDFKGKILDVGSNYSVFGIIAKQLDETREVHCLDGSAYACEVSFALSDKSKTPVNIYYNKIEDNVFEDKSFDAITILHTMEHIKDLHTLMTWLKRILKDDGTLFIAVPYKECNPSPSHIYKFCVNEIDDKKYVNIKHLLKNYGFIGNIKVFDGISKNECGSSKKDTQWNIYVKCKKVNEK